MTEEIMKHIIADNDGTIIARWTPDDYEPHPGPYTGYADAVLTNQGGLACKWAGMRWAREWPGLRATLKRVRFGMWYATANIALLAVYSDKQLATWRGRLMAWIGKHLPPVHIGGGIYISLKPSHHKPSPGGLAWLARKLDANVQDILYIGDSEDDKGAARAFGCSFKQVSKS